MTLRTDSADGWQLRQDRGRLLAAYQEANGTWLVEGYAAREGVLEYQRSDGTVFRELVTADTLKRAAPGMGRIPVTLGHPDDAKYPDGVTPDNVAELGVGDTDGEVEVHKGGFVKVRMAVRRRDAIDAIRAGTRELSPGYRARIDPTPGVHPIYGAYDAEQVERAPANHLAIVDAARGGAEVRFRADAAVATAVISGPTPNPSGAQPQGVLVKPGITRLLALLGVTSQVRDDDAAIEAACGAVEARNDSARKDAANRQVEADKAVGAERTRADSEKARADTEKVRADKAEAELATLKGVEKARADKAERESLEGTAKALGLDPAKHADSRGLARAIAGHKLGEEIKADASDAYVQALVDMARSDVAKRGDGVETGQQVWAGFATGGGGGGSGAPVVVVPHQDGAAGAGNRQPEYLSPVQIQRKRADAAFNAARGGST